MQFGHFDDTTREYVITRPDTPLPWINYLGVEAYFGIISNTGSGYSFYRDPRLRRIIRYRYNNIPLGFGGRIIYIRDDNNVEFWSPTWQPTRPVLEFYECRHGLGYTIICSKYKQIETKIKYFVPIGDNLELWHVKVSNYRQQSVKLSFFSFVEFCLWDAQDDATNFQRNLNIGEVEVESGIIYHKTEFRERRNHFAYFGCSGKVVGYDTQREIFLGSYHGLDSPIAIERGHLSNSKAHGWSPIGAHHIKIELDPGESKEFVFILGYYENKRDEKFDPPLTQTINKKGVLKILEKYFNLDNVNSAFLQLKQYWNELLDRFQIKTPDVHTNRMVNIWNQYQCMITFNISRAASFFESGIGRGMGFRDSNQDLLGFVHMIPTRARERIIDLAATQLKTGGAYHQYQTLTKRGNNEIGSNFNDDPLWLVLSVAAYLKETGDLSILHEMIPFENEPNSEQSLLEHLKRSLNYIVERRGPHGLPLIGRADWNDCLNLNCFSEEPGQSFQTTTNKDGKVAESIFIAALYVLASTEFASISDFLGEVKLSSQYLKSAEEMRSIILASGWDGDWFLRAYDDFGHKIGSKECEEGQIFIEPQGMCIMAKIGLVNGFATKTLTSVQKLLATPHGISLLYPPYSRYYVHLGEISSYPPGYKENGSIFCHTNPWIMIAEAIQGNGDHAHDYYLRINPSAREPISEIHRCEPYVYAQMIASNVAPTFGEAKNSWLTGTAAWNFVAISKWILGIQPQFTGLQITPAVPKSWKEFQVKRMFRGILFDILFTRSGPGNLVEIWANGIKIKGNIVPLPKDGTKKIDVKVVIY